MFILAKNCPDQAPMGDKSARIFAKLGKAKKLGGGRQIEGGRLTERLRQYPSARNSILQILTLLCLHFYKSIGLEFHFQFHLQINHISFRFIENHFECFLNAQIFNMLRVNPFRPKFIIFPKCFYDLLVLVLSLLNCKFNPSTTF